MTSRKLPLLPQTPINNIDPDIRAEVDKVLDKLLDTTLGIALAGFPTPGHTYTKLQASQSIAQLLTTNKAESLDVWDFVEPCEPDCTPERHAYHQGQWDLACRINRHYGYLPNPTEGLTFTPIKEVKTALTSLKGD